MTVAAQRPWRAASLPIPDPAATLDAMTVAPSEMRAFLAARDAARSTQLALLERTMAAALPGLARVLRDAGATRVLVFGSLVAGGLHEHSDLDLAVEGLPPERYFAVLGELLARAPVPVDLVALEDASASLVAHVLATGRDVAAAEDRP